MHEDVGVSLHTEDQPSGEQYTIDCFVRCYLAECFPESALWTAADARSRRSARDLLLQSRASKQRQTGKKQLAAVEAATATEKQEATNGATKTNSKQKRLRRQEIAAQERLAAQAEETARIQQAVLAVFSALNWPACIPPVYRYPDTVYLMAGQWWKPANRVLSLMVDQRRFAALTVEIEHFYEGISLRPFEQKSREQFRLYLERLIRATPSKLVNFAESKLCLFGSSLTGLCERDSDLDLTICFPPMVHVRGHEGAIIREVTRQLRRNRMGHIQPIAHARVPILKKVTGRGPPYDISVDRRLGIVNSEMILCYIRLDARVAPLCQLVKRWSKTYSINNSQNGLLSSYAFVILVLHFLQRRLVIPNLQQDLTAPRNIVEGLDCTYSELRGYKSPNSCSIGQLFLEFLVYYAHFDYEHQVISIKHSGELRKADRKLKAPSATSGRSTAKQRKEEEPSDEDEEGDDDMDEDADHDQDEDEDEDAEDEDAEDEDEDDKEYDVSEVERTTARSSAKVQTWQKFVMCIEDPFEDRNLAAVITMHKLDCLRLVCATSFLALQRYSIHDLFANPNCFQAISTIPSAVRHQRRSAGNGRRRPRYNRTRRRG